MRVTTKGQVTIPRQIEFVEEKNRVYIVKKKEPGDQPNRFRKLRGVATVRMTTDEIMALTRKR
jgi:bifunctional DNA-binding transcriptional regulator/antitoxin component of YhaV-PrlF toxin-antitoxin module